MDDSNKIKFQNLSDIFKSALILIHKDDEEEDPNAPT